MHVNNELLLEQFSGKTYCLGQKNCVHCSTERIWRGQSGVSGQSYNLTYSERSVKLQLYSYINILTEVFFNLVNLTYSEGSVQLILTATSIYWRNFLNFWIGRAWNVTVFSFLATTKAGKLRETIFAIEEQTHERKRRKFIWYSSTFGEERSEWLRLYSYNRYRAIPETKED